MDNSDLYRIAEEDDIGIFSYNLPKTQSMSAVLPDGYMAIGIDYNTIMSTADERVHLAHEIGHCKTGSFYNQYSEFDIREKHERRANVYAVKRLVPIDILMGVLDDGYREVYELAEYFSVTEEFMRFALGYYNLCSM